MKGMTCTVCAAVIGAEMFTEEYNLDGSVIRRLCTRCTKEKDQRDAEQEKLNQERLAKNSEALRQRFPR